jgi:hypothetical protein
MDIWLNKNRFSDYFFTMANLEARQLHNLAQSVSAFHLKDGLVRIQFQKEIRSFIDAQLSTIRAATTDTECQTCIQNLKQEREHLSFQDRLLRTGEAKLQASIQFIQNEKVWGYVINGVGVVLSSLQVIAGLGVIAASVATGTVIGVGFGAMLTLHGANGIMESISNLVKGTDNSQGPLKKGYIAGAEFLGFDAKTGEAVYSGMDLLLSAYGIIRLIRKPEAWRLFHYLNTDYVRGIKSMSRFELGVEIYNDSMALKSLYDNRTQN